MTPESATRGLHGTNSPNIFPIDETHSDMVKFEEGSQDYRRVREVLIELEGLGRRGDISRST